MAKYITTNTIPDDYENQISVKNYVFFNRSLKNF